MSPGRSTAKPAALTKVADVRWLVEIGRRDPPAVFPAIERLAASNAWQTREVAATALVEIGKRQPQAVLAQRRRWAARPMPMCGELRARGSGGS